MLAAAQKATDKEYAMSDIKIGSFTLVGALFGLGGFALISFGSKIGPITITRDPIELSSDDEQRARAARIVAERKATIAAEARAAADEKAAEAARRLAVLDIAAVEKMALARRTKVGEILVEFCAYDGGTFRGPTFTACIEKMIHIPCPASGRADWNMRLDREGGVLFIC